MLPFYEEREQTAVKHEVLERYLSAFVPIVGDWASDIAYIDCLAGPWQSADPGLADTSFARAIKVLRSTRVVLEQRGKSPSMRCLLIEKNRDAFQKLNAYSERVSNIDVTAKHWDFTEHVEDIVRFVGSRKRSFPFVFIDPKGWEQLQVHLISPILELNPGEVLINFMTSWVVRFLSVEGKHFEQLFGHDWQRLVHLNGEEQEAEVVSSYAGAIRRAGHFKYVCTLPVMKSTQDAFHFHLIYGTRHIKGVEVFKQTEKHVIPFMHETRAVAQRRRRLLKSGQEEMFEPAAGYKEAKFTRHQMRNLDVAKAELRSKFESLGTMQYREAWATAMQHSGVMDSDFRQWLEEWRTDGRLKIEGQATGKKFARVGPNQRIEWLP